MITNNLKTLKSHGVQYIKELESVELTPLFRGRPVISTGIADDNQQVLKELCPVGAIGINPLSIDLGRCVFCRECEFANKAAVRFTNDYRMATTVRENLIIREGEDKSIAFGVEHIDPKVQRLFKKSLHLREVCAGGDNSTEMELNAVSNVNFDFVRFGVEFTASPRHADGVVVTGAVTSSMSVPLELCYNAIPEPKIIIAAGSDAISGGVFADSSAIDRRFFERHKVDIYVPGNPVHPMTFIDAITKFRGESNG